MDDFAELALEGASNGVDHYEKVYHPVKNQAKKLPNSLKKFRGQSAQDQGQAQDQYDDYNSPRRSNTDRDPRGSTRDRDVRGGDDDYEYEPVRRSNTDRIDSRRDRVRGGNGYVEETYERRSSGRAKSAGRDGYQGSGGRGLHRDDRRRSWSIALCPSQLLIL